MPAESELYSFVLIMGQTLFRCSIVVNPSSKPASHLWTRRYFLRPTSTTCRPTLILQARLAYDHYDMIQTLLSPASPTSTLLPSLSSSTTPTRSCRYPFNVTSWSAWYSSSYWHYCFSSNTVSYSSFFPLCHYQYYVHTLWHQYRHHLLP